MSRLIDADALLESLNANCEDLCHDKNTNWCEYCCPHNDFEDLIDDAPTVEERPQGKWIPVSVQEPNVGGIYLVTAKHVSGHIGIDIARRLSDDVWTFGGEELSDTEIMAWMPLPEAYKEAENE